MPFPYYMRLLVASEDWEGDVIHSPSGDYTVAQAQVQLEQIALRMNQWLKPSGYGLQFNCAVTLSPENLAFWQQGNTDGLGEGFNNLTDIVTQDPVLLAAWNANFDRMRCATIFVRGGGYAAGQLLYVGSEGLENVGRAVVGDVDFSPALTGVKDPWQILHDLPFFPGRSLSHEMCHSMGMYCHASNRFDEGEFDVPGLYIPIADGFQVVPLEGNVPSVTEQNAHESQFYQGMMAQFVKFNGPWLRPAL